MGKCEGSHNETRGSGAKGVGHPSTHIRMNRSLSISPPLLEDGFDRGDFIKCTSDCLIDSF